MGVALGQLRMLVNPCGNDLKKYAALAKTYVAGMKAQESVSMLVTPSRNHQVMLVVRPVRPQPSSGSSSSGSISSKHHSKNVVDGLTTTTATMATATTKAPAPAPALASQPGHDFNMGCTYKYAVCTYEYTGPPV